jgi:hypothetical protein
MFAATSTTVKFEAGSCRATGGERPRGLDVSRPQGVAEGSPFAAWQEPDIILKSHPLGRFSPPSMQASPRMTNPPAHRLLTIRRRSPPEQTKK